MILLFLTTQRYSYLITRKKGKKKRGGAQTILQTVVVFHFVSLFIGHRQTFFGVDQVYLFAASSFPRVNILFHKTNTYLESCFEIFLKALTQTV